jgi:hypothetical protein
MDEIKGRKSFLSRVFRSMQKGMRYCTIEFALELVSRENNQGLAESLPGRLVYFLRRAQRSSIDWVLEIFAECVKNVTRQHIKNISGPYKFLCMA